MSKAFKRIIRGARYSEEYGSHPGTPWLIFFIVMGVVAGADSGILGALGGAAFMASFFGPMWLIGCWDRGATPDTPDQPKEINDG